MSSCNGSGLRDSSRDWLCSECGVSNFSWLVVCRRGVAGRGNVASFQPLSTRNRVPCRAGYGLPEYRIRFRNTGLPDGRIRKGLSQQGFYASAAVVSQHVEGGFPKTENCLYHFFCRHRIPAGLPRSPQCRLTSMRPDWTTCRLTGFGSHPAYQICCQITAGSATRYADGRMHAQGWPSPQNGRTGP